MVCTGGVFEDSKRLVRLYPIPLRFMDDRSTFKKYQLIEAHVQKSSDDSRPESFKIRPDGITPLGTISSEKGTWATRAQAILIPENLFQSVEALREQQKRDGTSLGLVMPATIEGIFFERYPADDRARFQTRYDALVSQLELPIDPATRRVVRPLTAPDYRFKVRFRCDDPACLRTHEFTILDWEIDALYFGQKSKGRSPEQAARDVVARLNAVVCSPDKALRFFLGNIHSHPDVFCIVGFWYPKKPRLDPRLRLL